MAATSHPNSASKNSAVGPGYGSRLAVDRGATYGKYMAGALKTTVYLDPQEYERLKDIARVENRAPAEVLREAVAEYTARRRPRQTPKSLGAGHSRRGDVSERAEELLEGMGRQK